METETEPPIDTNVGIRPEKYDLYVEADNLIAERLGISPGPEMLISIIIENEEDPLVLAELYCLSLLNQEVA